MKAAQAKSASDTHKRISKYAIEQVANKIAKTFDPEKIILFGSYAYGKPQPYSDVDLLVVMNTNDGPLAKQQEISRALSPHPFGMDILVQTPANLKERLALGDSFLREITTRGVVLYERARQ